MIIRLFVNNFQYQNTKSTLTSRIKKKKKLDSKRLEKTKNSKKLIALKKAFFIHVFPPKHVRSIKSLPRTPNKILKTHLHVSSSRAKLTPI